MSPDTRAESPDDPTAAPRTVLGVDGCSAGWIAISLPVSPPVEHPLDIPATEAIVTVHERFVDALCAAPDADPVLVDIPIGIPAADRRTADEEARTRLGARGASVFPTPCRRALDAPDHETAGDRQEAATGSRISIQAWNLRPAILDVDGCLRTTPTARARVRESHPEVCFAALNGDEPMAASKRSDAGREERLTVLSDRLPGARAVYERATAATRRTDVARDDVVDALCLAVSATRLLATIPSAVPTDEYGLPMAIAYPTVRESTE